VFSLAGIGVVVAGELAAGLAFTLYGLVPSAHRKYDWWGPLLNIAAPALGGVAVFAPLAAFCSRRNLFTPSLRGHMVRTVLWYAFVAWVISVIVSNRDNSDFGLWGQIIEWPMFALLAAIAADAGFSLRRTARSGTVRSAAG
jgi:hypothetical protein